MKEGTYYSLHREEVLAKAKVRREKQLASMTDEEREQKNESNRQYYWQNRERILARMRAKREKEDAEKPIPPPRAKKPRKEKQQVVRMRSRVYKERKKRQRDNKTAKSVKERFFLAFSEYHCAWLRELVARYKEYGYFPVLPTQIADYYTDADDKAIALLSAILMSWSNGTELEQIASMRKLMGASPWQWFCKREFVVLSLGREQMRYIDGYHGGSYWKVAKLYDLLYELCHTPTGIVSPIKAFRKVPITTFLHDVAHRCQLTNADYKCGVVEMAFRTHDGIGQGLLKTSPSRVRCPQSPSIRKFLAQWFPDWNNHWWEWDEAVALFRLQYDYDFWYAYHAYHELASRHPDECRRYATRYKTWWDRHETLPGHRWTGSYGVIPVIEFNQTQNENPQL